MSVEFVTSTFSSIRSVRFPLVIHSCTHQQEHVALCGLYRVPGQFPFPNSSSRTSLGPTELNYRLTQLHSTPIHNRLVGCTPSHLSQSVQGSRVPISQVNLVSGPRKIMESTGISRAVEIPCTLLPRVISLDPTVLHSVLMASLLYFQE